MAPTELSVYTLIHAGDERFVNEWLKSAKSVSADLVVVLTSPISWDKYIQLDSEPTVSLFEQYQHCPRYSSQWDQAALRNFAVDQCRHKWVLQLDVDESVFPQFRCEIVTAIWNRPNQRAFALPTINYWDSFEQLRVDHWFFPDWHYRVFKKGIQYKSGARHLRLDVRPDVRGVRSLFPHKSQKQYLNYSLASCIHHHKYLRALDYDGMYRCGRRDVRTEAEYRLGARTIPVESLRAMFSNRQPRFASRSRH